MLIFSLLSGNCRNQKDDESEIHAAEQALSDFDAQLSAIEAQLREKDDEIQSLQTEKELQSSGEVKELAQEADELSKKYVVSSLNEHFHTKRAI